jgi:hypothetical protein
MVFVVETVHVKQNGRPARVHRPCCHGCRYHQQQLAALIHPQMQLPEHRREKATGYLLISHDAINGNMTLEALASRFAGS